MKIVITFIICLGFSICVNAQRCATPKYIEQIASGPAVQPTLPNTETAFRDTLPDEVIVIPVVIHVLYHTNAQNISDQQILSQLAALNEDYRRQNADTINTPTAFKSIAADTRIVFCLAKVDPKGNYTSGIIRKYTSTDLFLSDDAMKFSSSGGDDTWDSKKYLNIWVCNLFGRTLGYSVMPGAPADKDGIVIQYNVFGTTPNIAPPYNKGRTVTHEVGHWLGLKHLWGDAVCGNDGIDDTPAQQTNNSGCPSFPHLSNCSINFNGDMFMDYMDFTDDACMNMFTNGQKKEMRSLFALGNVRNSFLNSAVCDSSLAAGGPLPSDTANHEIIALSVYPNPFVNEINIVSSSLNEVDAKTVTLYDITGKLLISQKIISQKTSLNVSKLPPGMYLLKINGSTDSPRLYKLIK